ncbi:hypothetical protein TH66_14610 [Carbonactinospora thermoautotrophica]|uniref:CRISPR-associated protein Cas6 C-terminal domain-containing protein n=1 Tax=Carbonactinospora thermoautotrophica TaxID=1469144 RepID=A0A132MRW6_9ACTN|nr:CRISPR system precrRNA processing endoribonuclease RAMP protein Cas6 [Carbonactinospora thermoautotrophica]KWX00142.1 hypothetical protein TH66_14610 [Carbonactinospora thermoautotrophica]KWX07524.1 hypothetical protein TR74_18500 [Carbonactinospora thermoautotrophica]
MPTRWTIDLAEDPGDPLHTRYDAVHGIACALLEHPHSDHTATTKPFAARVTPTPGGLAAGPRITLTWLTDPPPAVTIPAALPVGPWRVPVVATGQEIIPYPALEAAPVAYRVRFDVTSPAVFHHHGRDYPLPDPHITYTSLARRYLALRGATGTLTPEQARELAKTVTVRDHDIRTRPFTWHGRVSVGFTGTVTFHIPRDTPHPLAAAFTTLSLFAGLAGLGRGTTHGLGAVTVTR